MPQIQTLVCPISCIKFVFRDSLVGLGYGFHCALKKVCSNPNPGTCEGNVIWDFADVIKLRWKSWRFRVGLKSNDWCL